MYGILNLSLSNYFSKAIYFRLGTTINISVLIQTLNLYPSDYFQAAVLDTNYNKSFSLGHLQQHKVNKL